MQKVTDMVGPVTRQETAYWLLSLYSSTQIAIVELILIYAKAVKAAHSPVHVCRQLLAGK